MKVLVDVMVGLLLVMMGVGLTLIGLHFGGYELPGYWGTIYAVSAWTLIIALLIISLFSYILQYL